MPRVPQLWPPALGKGRRLPGIGQGEAPTVARGKARRRKAFGAGEG